MLRDKPDAFLETSPKGTVPVLDTGAEVLEESLDIMKWALAQNDPEGWLDMPDDGHELIETCDGPFKSALDRYKYHTRYSDADPGQERERCSAFLLQLETRFASNQWLFGDAPTLADMAIVTFVRQFANTDRCWFHDQPWPETQSWLDAILASNRFERIMRKHPLWHPGR